jgi:transcriptional regulator with XRE-family HTH domain
MDQGQTIGGRIREARKRSGLSQRELAQASGVSLSLISKLEQGERQDTSTQTIRKLAAALAVTTTALLGRDPRPRPASAEPSWEPVRHALTDPAATPFPGEVTESGVTSALDAAVKLYHDNQYDDLALVLPGLLRDAQAATPLLR